jgi:hypothetical protein
MVAVRDPGIGSAGRVFAAAQNVFFGLAPVKRNYERFFPSFFHFDTLRPLAQLPKLGE